MTKPLTSSIASRNSRLPTRSRCFSPAGALRSRASPTTRFIKTSPKKITSSPFAPSLADARLAPPPTSSTTTACGGWLNLRKLWPRCSILIRIFCPCQIHEKPQAVSDRCAAQFPSRHFPETAAITPQLRAGGVKKIVDVAQKHKLTTAGIFSSSESVEGIFNSRGLSRLAHADSGGSFHHHAGRRFFGMAEGQLARRGQS